MEFKLKANNRNLIDKDFIKNFVDVVKIERRFGFWAKAFLKVSWIYYGRQPRFQEV